MTPNTTPTSDASDLPEALINIAREIEALKRDCGMDPESSIAVQNGRYRSLSYKVRALAAKVGAVESNTADAAPTQGATYMENLQRTAVGWQGRALRAERNWAVCRRWAIAGGAPVEKLGDDPDQPFHAASPAIEGESKWWPCPVAAPGPADGESNV